MQTFVTYFFGVVLAVFVISLSVSAAEYHVGFLQLSFPVVSR